MNSYVIGGFVRDLLLEGADSTPKDIDIVVIGSGIDLDSGRWPAH